MVRRADRLREPDDVEEGRRRVSQLLGGIDLSTLRPDDVIDPADIPSPDDIFRRQGRYEIFRNLAVEEGYTLAELIEYAANSTGHWTIIGTVDDVVQEFGQRFHADLTDGFNLWPSHYPDGLTAITRRLLPELQSAGLFVPAVEQPGTFRENFTTPQER